MPTMAVAILLLLLALVACFGRLLHDDPHRHHPTPRPKHPHKDD